MPHVPSGWRLRPGTGLLKGFRSDLVSDDREQGGITAEDVQQAQIFAWHSVLTAFLRQYDVSGWSAAPPIPLQQAWELLGAAYLVRILAHKYNVDEPENTSLADQWEDRAYETFRKCKDPKNEGERVCLMHPHTGAIIPKRSGVSVPYANNPIGFIAWPDKDTDTSHGLSTDQSAEELYKMVTRRANTG